MQLAGYDLRTKRYRYFQVPPHSDLCAAMLHKDFFCLFMIIMPHSGLMGTILKSASSLAHSNLMSSVASFDQGFHA